MLNFYVNENAMYECDGFFSNFLIINFNKYSALAELKQLVLGTVKDLTPNPHPINIQITSNKDRAPTTTTPKPKKVNKYKYKQDSMLAAYAKSRDPEFNSDEELSWKRPQSTSFILPPYDDDEGLGEHYLESNEITDFNGGGIGSLTKVKGSGEKGWFDTAKAVFRAPNHVVNSYSKSFNRYVTSIRKNWLNFEIICVHNFRWRGGGKPKQPQQRHRPIADITYSPEQRRRNKQRPPPSRSGRRPNSRPRGRPYHRRRGQSQKPHNRRTSYFDDKYDTSEYSSHQNGGGRYSSSSYSNGYYGGGDKAWDRTDHLTSVGAIFDSTMPQDDMPYNMNPPMPY